MTRYIWAIRFLPLIIRIDEEGEAQIYINGVHTAHINRKSHFRIYLTIGRRAIMSVLKKLGLVIISSTETEVVTDREYFPKCS